jgi:hypothetical protein
MRFEIGDYVRGIVREGSCAGCRVTEAIVLEATDDPEGYEYRLTL